MSSIRREIIRDILTVADELGRDPSWREYAERGTFSQYMIEKHLGSWNDAIHAVGGEPNTNGDTTVVDLRRDLKRVSNTYGVSPSNYDERGSYSSRTIYRRFGSWENAFTDRMPEYSPDRPKSEEALAGVYSFVTDQLGHEPSYREMEDAGLIHPSTYIRRYGSWSRAKKMMRFTGNN